MKNYLLKIACLSTLCFGLFMISCSESDNDDSSDNQDQVDDSEDSSDGGSNIDDPTNGDNPSDGDGDGSTVVLTNTCSVCPELVITSISFTYRAGTVCKGEDGKAYYENGEPVDELGQSYEDHIANFGQYARFCDPVE